MSMEDWAYGILNERMRKSTMARERSEGYSAESSTPLEQRKPPQGGSGTAGQQSVDYSELSQLRAEVAMLRAQQQRYEDYTKETETQKKAYADFLAWVALTAEEKTQLVADKKFANDPGELWEVQLQEHPKVRLPATSRFDAIGKYQELCGITATAHEFSATCLAPAA